MNDHINLFLKSLLDRENSLNKTSYALEWIRDQNEMVEVKVSQIPFYKLKNWKLTEEKLHHESGKFFSIDGIDVKTNAGNVHHWQQPIINQPEIGYLGFITKEFNGVLHFLMQAKIEPGNINYVQLSPSLQATRSNYSRVHKGNAPAYLEYFQNATKEEILLDQLQSEQGARFLKKRNRNIIIKIEKEIEVLENFLWLTLAQIKELMRYDNVINMDTRTVISGIPLGDFSLESIEVIRTMSNICFTKYTEALLRSSSYEAQSYNSLNDVILFITNQKCNYDLEVQKMPLSDLKDWVIGENSIHHKDRKYFEIIAADIKIGNREVINWSQPMVRPVQEGICAFICKSINGVLHFIVQAKLECGNFDVIEFAPTVQCLTDNYRTEYSLGALPFLKEVLNAKPENIIFDTFQSEEGGRFYREQNKSMVIFADEGFPIELPENYIWMTYSQMQTFMKHNNYVNIQARSLLSALTFDL
ncbi:NDP-hexose 2,3-dehydratase family protein [Antarcticibacterium sp. 1MA-6-2]|uniref:NDP-hexose 2,3-dehydratase family protein n=1 Tax=Antarcticibacterium sp. 1MA-6-2 TaxID=2908210 RepID=UPI001F25D010|nr:NDP-hexose 2,3-dehydratase family protein [Antarcticibacterium sp. 1MA-6-2]UJH91294.1 NDP-hexose 2,3-dehydratase family protein [Antarcticibacterium sp. 1MA-6-2]